MIEPVETTPTPPAPPFELEHEFQATLALLGGRRRSSWAGLVFLGSLLAFVLVQQGSQGPLDLALLVGALFLHEGGHWAAMRLLGWQDVRIFFIPFFGAATSGRRSGAAGWKQGIVLLAGPLPGLVLGVVLLLLARTVGDASPALRSAGIMLVAVNAFNLLPFSPLDGGRLFEVTIFQRHRYLELAFLVLAVAGLAAIALAMGEVVLGIVAALVLVSVPARARLLRITRELRARGLAVPEDASKLDGEAGRETFRHVWSGMDPQGRTEARAAQTLTGLGELGSRATPGALASAALLAAWLLGLVVSLGGAAVAVAARPLDWREVRDPGGRYTVELPGEPGVEEASGVEGGPPGSSRTLRFTRGDYGFLVAELPPPEDESALEDWWRGVTGGMGEGVVVTFSGSEPFQGRPALAARLEEGGNAVRLVGFVHAGRRYLLLGAAPKGDPAVERFFASFALLE